MENAMEIFNTGVLLRRDGQDQYILSMLTQVHHIHISNLKNFQAYTLGNLHICSAIH